jgi:hypothetical protein
MADAKGQKSRENQSKAIALECPAQIRKDDVEVTETATYHPIRSPISVRV